MKRLFNISSLLVVLALIGLFGCRRGGRSLRVRPAGQHHLAMPAGVEGPGGMVAVALRPSPAPQDAEAFLIEPDLIVPPTPVVQRAGAVLGEGGEYTVSRVYPCSECGNVQLDKVMPRNVELNKPFSYTLRIRNLRDKTLRGIVLTEKLPENFTLTGAEPTAQQDGENLVWDIDSLGPLATIEFSVSGSASKTESLEYCTNVVTPLDATCSRIDVIQPRLKLTKVAAEGVLLCDPIRVKYVVTNTGTGTARDVKIVDTLPQGLKTVDGKSELVISVGTLNAGQIKEFTAQLKASKAGKYVSKATASSSDGLSAESEPVATVVDQPVLVITQSGPTKQYVGRAVTYEITVTNESDAPAVNAVIENEIPAGVTSMKATAGARLSGRTITWRLGTLGPKASKTVQISFAPTRAATITNKVSASARCAETVTASTQTVVAAIPAVLLEVIDISDPVEIGGRATYVITVTNQGSAPSTNITIECFLEDNMRYASSSGPTSGTIENGSLIFAPLARLAPKARAVWRIVVTALKEGDTRFKVTMNADELSRPVEETEATRVYE